MNEAVLKPNLYHYTDVRHYLKDYFGYLKGKNSRFSYNAWSKALGVKDSTTILKVLRGQRNIGPDLAEKFLKYFAFPAKQAEYFNDLVTLTKIGKNSRLGTIIHSSLDREEAQIQVKKIKGTQSSLYESIWPTIVKIVLSLGVGAHAKTEKEICEMFDFKVPVATVKRALQVLEEAHLVQQEKSGYFKVDTVCTEPSEEISKEQLKQLHLQGLEMTAEIIREFGFNEEKMALNAYVIPLRKDDFPAFKRDLVTYLRTLADKYIPPSDAEEVYHLHQQFVPLATKKS